MRPDVVHHVALKPILYGSVGARSARVPAAVNGFAGLGYTFIESGRRKGVLRFVMGKALRWALTLPNSRVVFQNAEDAGELVDAGIVRPHQVQIIRGVGVDTDKFSPPTRLKTRIRSLWSCLRAGCYGTRESENSSRRRGS